MNDFKHQVQTNPKPGSRVDRRGYPMPARAFFLVFVDEVGKDGFLVRRCYASLTDPGLKNFNLTPLQAMGEVFPEKYGLMPKNFKSPFGIAEHVLGENASSYVSTSSLFPEGVPNWYGKKVFIDIAKAKASGAEVVSTDQIVTALTEYKASNPHLTTRIDKLTGCIQNIEKEVLIRGERVPAKAIFTESSLAATKGLVRAARVVQVIGVVLTAYDLEQASEKSFKTKSIKPISAEVIRQAGGWGAAATGFKIGAVAGAVVGIETGPGAILTGLIGGIIFGTAGYFGADWIADHIDEN